MSMSTRGMTISWAMSEPLSDLAERKAPRRGDNVVDLRHGRLLQHRTIGNGRLDAAEPQDRRLEIIEGLAFGDDRGNLGADAQRLHPLVDGEEPRRLLDAFDDRGLIDRSQRP